MLHARGGATLGAAAAAAFGTSYAPYFVPSGDLLRRIVAFFGYAAEAEAAGFPAERLVARSPSARQLLLLSDAALSLLRADSRGALRVIFAGQLTLTLILTLNLTLTLTLT